MSAARAALALALLALATGARADVCAPASSGTVTANTQTLADVVLPAGTKDYDVTLPDGVCTDPAHPTHVGTTVTACDNDAAPTVTMTDPKHAHVSRNGDYAQEQGVVHVTVYCA